MSVWVIFDCSTNKPIDICEGNIIAYMDVFYNVTVMKTRFFGDVEPNIELVFYNMDFIDTDKPFQYYAIPVTGRYPNKR